MTRAEFLKMMGAGAAVLALDAVPGASLIQSANAQTTPLKKNQERLAFGLPDQEAKVDKPVTAIVIGAGSRGSVYASYSSEYSKALKIVGVADINSTRRDLMKNLYGIAPEHCFGDWKEVFNLPKFIAQRRLPLIKDRKSVV